jgi:hypothetical protein
MTNCRTVTQRRHRQVACRPLLIGIGIALSLGSVSVAEASTYRVYTSSAATSMNVNSNDGMCTLAEAVLHVNGANRSKYCDDFASGSAEHRIELLQAANTPYSSNHFKIGSLTITSSKRVSIAGFGAFIDSTGYSAFVIGAKGATGVQPTVFFERVTLTNAAATAGGRLIENYGNLQLYAVTITKGDVTGSQHDTGRGGGIFNAGTISFAQNSLITSNKAKRGGGIYNDAGFIYDLAVTISWNSATLAGGGIYNRSSTSSGEPANGLVLGAGLTITRNTANSGGGVFNRSKMEVQNTAITSNTAFGGTSDERCALNQVCDGSGGGVMNMHSSGATASFRIEDSSTISDNVASKFGGGVYSVGTLNLAAMTISGNRAQTGAAILSIAPTDGSGHYCNVSGNTGPVTINNNIASINFSILAGNGTEKCIFFPPVTGSGNSNLRCDMPSVHSSSTCPQPNT